MSLHYLITLKQSRLQRLLQLIPLLGLGWMVRERLLRFIDANVADLS